MCIYDIDVCVYIYIVGYCDLTVSILLSFSAILQLCTCKLPMCCFCYKAPEPAGEQAAINSNK